MNMKKSSKAWMILVVSVILSTYIVHYVVQTEIYSFTYDGRIYCVTYDYKESDILDVPQYEIDSYNLFLNTPDKGIDGLVRQLEDITSRIDDLDRVQLVLAFVQQCIVYDYIALYLKDYSVYTPANILHDRVGNCSETSYLFATLIYKMGYDIRAQYYSHGDTGHTNIGVDVYHDGVYHTCETTSMLPFIDAELPEYRLLYCDYYIHN